MKYNVVAVGRPVTITRFALMPVTVGVAGNDAATVLWNMAYELAPSAAVHVKVTSPLATVPVRFVGAAIGIALASADWLPTPASLTAATAKK